MSDSKVPTPADLAEKVARTATNETGEKKGEPIRLPDDHPLVTALEALKEENRVKAEKLAEFEQAQMTEAERAEARVKAAEERAAQLEAANTRKDVAIKYGLSKDDAALLENLTDPDVMDAFAQRLADAAALAAGPRPPKPHPAQRAGDAHAEDKDAVARVFFGI